MGNYKYTSLLPSSSRRDIVVIATIVCLLTLVITFRSVFTDHAPWHPKVTAPSNTDPTNPPLPDQEENGVSASTPTKPLTTFSTSLLPSTTPISLATSTSTPPPPRIAAQPGCENFPDTSDILLVMKTGATEAYEKLPIHFSTTLRCNNDSLYFSDMEMSMGGHHLIDALADVATEVRTNNDDFKLYDKLKQYHDLREDPRPLKEGNVGWNLDKYKFLHMLLKTWEYRSDAKWYVFIEADTALIWDNLVPFLARHQASEEYYFGSPTYLDIEFAHGGTGYIISQAAMQAAVGNHPDIAQKYDKELNHICCGDWSIGRVLLDEGIHLTRAWPMLNGEKPSTLPFARNHWCQPVMTMHHMTAQEVSQAWTFQQERKQKGITKPLMFIDIFNHFVLPLLLPRREHWDNLATDLLLSPPSSEDAAKPKYDGRTWAELSETQRSSPDGPDACRKACEEDKDCYGWRHHDRECGLGHTIKLGGTKVHDEQSKWVSGWMMERVEEFRQGMGGCEKVDWTL